MPIPQADINTNWLWVAPNETVGQIQARLPADRKVRAYKYIVFATSDSNYIVARWLEIEQIAAASGQDIRATPIGMLKGLPKPVIGIEQNSMGLSAAGEERDSQPGKRLVILSNGQPIGLLTREMLSGEALPADPFVAVPKRPTVLGVEDEPVVAAAGAAPPAPATDTRVINGWIEGHSADKPLQVRTPYELKFNVAQKRADAMLTVGGIGRALFEGVEGDLVTVLVVLEPGDFTLYGVDSLEIISPKAANVTSKNTVTFTIEAKKEGTNKLNAIFYVNGKLFQKVEWTIQVGGKVAEGEKAVRAEATGLTMVSAMSQPIHTHGQPVNVMILAKDAGYQVIVQGGGVARAFLKISADEIAGWLKHARKTLHDIVHLQDANGNFLYQASNTTIDADIHTSSLKKLAEAGMFLFDELFYGNSGPDARAMGDLLKELSRKRQLQVQIVAEKFFFPWSLLYDGDDPDNPDPKQFWGFKHIIEYLPEFSSATPVNFVPAIEIGDTLDMAFVCNNGIDTQFGAPIVQGQRDAFNALPGVSVKDYANTQDFINLMKDPNAPPLIYFYCHAVSKFPGEEGGVDDSKIALTDAKIALRELKLKVRTSLPPLLKAPLVFLNACESAELSPYLYDGLMPFMIARGVRGMIGTEVETPALFAAEFAKDFIRRFAAGGQPLGELLLNMRCEYLEQKNNVMGLVYALYSSGDVVVQRPA
jgi:CHAT domain-containing protein